MLDLKPTNPNLLKYIYLLNQRSYLNQKINQNDCQKSKLLLNNINKELLEIKQLLFNYKK